MSKGKDILKDDEILIPEAPHEPEINANTMILFGKEKCGKTTALAQLENAIIVDTESGSKKVKALALLPPEDRGPVGKMAWLKKVGEKLSSMEKKYDYVVLDTLTEVNDWAEWSGTYRYMNTSQGKSFNRVKDEKGFPVKGGAFLDPTSDDYLSVHTLPDGNGYKWSREEVLNIFHLFQKAANKCVIFVCHVEDKFVGNKEAGDTVIPKQLALTGKLRDILPRKVDAIGYVYSNEGKISVNFKSSDERTGGTRASHLRGYNGPLDWSKIFIEEK